MDDGDSDDLVTAHSRVSPVPSADDSEVEIEQQIQRIIAENFDEETRAQFSTALILEAIEAQIQDVIMSIGTQQETDDELQNAIKNRFLAKQRSIEEVTGCSASQMPTKKPPPPPIPFDKYTLAEACLVCGFLYFVVPVALLLLLIFVFSRTKVSVCVNECHCSVGESFLFACTFYLATQLPRCIFFTWLTNNLVHEGAEHHTRLSHQRKLALATLCFSSLVLAVAAQVLTSSLSVPRYLTVPIHIIAYAGPFFAYCLLKGWIASSASIILLQLAPLVLQVLSPSYVQAPQNALIGWFFVIAIAERCFFYGLFAIMPDSSNAVARTASVHIITFFFQAAMLAVPLLVNTDSDGYIIGIFAALVVLWESLLSTHVLDRVLIYFANALPGSNRQYMFTSLDLRLMSAYSRQLSLVLATLAALACVGVNRLPASISTVECDGSLDTTADWLRIAGNWGIMAGATTVSCLAAVFIRYMNGAVIRPLIVPWRVAAFTGTYLVMITPSAFEYAFK